MEGQSTLHVMPAYVVHNTGRDLAKEFAGTFPIHPAAWWHTTTTKEERAMLGRDAGVYCFPTVELVDWLRTFIGNRSAIEIGAGAGVLCKALGIRGTDSYLQNKPDVAAMYAATGQRTVYGDHVQKIDANAAAKIYKPDVIVGSWITHRYDERRHELGGNMFGPDFPALLDDCVDLVLVCNTLVHGASPMFELPHVKLPAPWLVSRAYNGTPEFLAIWKGRRA